MVIDHQIEGTLLEALTLPKEVDTKAPNPTGKQTEIIGAFASVQTPLQSKTSAGQWRTEFKESDTGLIAAHVREKGMACIRRGDGTYGYKFKRNGASNFVADANNDEDGSSGVLGIICDEIIENINKNSKMMRTEKRLTRASVKKRFDLEVRMEAKRRSYTDHSKAVRRAARAIRRGDNPGNWRQVVGDVPLSPDDPYASEGVYLEEGLKFINTTLVQDEQQETLENLENQLREDMEKREEVKAVATSGPAEEDNIVATSDPTAMQDESVADPEHKDDQASTAVAVGASAEKPAMGLVSATSSLNTNELTWKFDTGATSHMCKDIGVFVTFEPLESSMETATNTLRILGKGTVRFPVKDATNAARSVELNGVSYVPRVAHNLFSVIKALVNDVSRSISTSGSVPCIMIVGDMCYTLQVVEEWTTTSFVALVSVSVRYLRRGMLTLKGLCVAGLLSSLL
ncbi:unnamed protein product [Phytophthora fragariaefolia]|uniref:Unnamed protein product n=1 Tax=Phytophthora fragariaefolia TaxID=1490495 RepID=A0A9W7CSW4_9STRA|nr:unnamed protein product [Phytophthora fragariaefolia]